MKTENLLLDEVCKLNSDNFNKLIQDIKRKLADNTKNRKGEDRVSEDPYTFCLGAGVSISAGLPDWYTLLSKIAGRLLYLPYNKRSGDSNNDKSGQKSEKQNSYRAYTTAKNEIFEKYAYDDMFKMKLEAAYEGKYKYIFQGEDTLELAEAIYEFIFEGAVKDGCNTEVAGDSGRGKIDEKEMADFYVKQFVKDICTPCVGDFYLQGSVLGAIVAILTEINPLSKKEIITYNYDDLLEKSLCQVGGIKTDEINSYGLTGEVDSKNNKGQYHIYHVHGYLPITEEANGQESDKIILTESSYMNIEKIGYHWMHVIQSYKYHTNILIFVGFSGQDYNFRRILRNLSSGEAAHHYIFICIDDIVDRVFKKQKDFLDENEYSQFINDRKKLKEEYSFELVMLNQILSAKSLYWEKHGLITIWTTISELPGMLLKLKEGIQKR